ncbi:TlpA family protein disulfide reductase [Sulfurimonas sp. SAG-AH-194-L11]|nr:TlpA disulfide reductase family protein [Sulfurimonas sp. SAG-AH-194-L11]MDF1877725.1 TlpA family protein disulfide reductase [Sulfurimonas sp. SAG-AH-194-L11]
MKKIIILLTLVLSLYAGVGVGDKAIAFELTTLDGKKSFSMSDFKGEVILLNLWASWCGGCKKEMPEFFELQKEHKNGFKIVTVNIDKSCDDAQNFMSSVEEELSYKTPFISLYNPSKSLAKAYGARGMPSSYLIDKNGIVTAVMVGSLSHEDILELEIKIEKLK